MALAGPHLVRAAVGEDVTQEELGGSRVHCRVSGVGDLEVADDEACIAADQALPELLSVALRAGPAGAACADPVDRMDEELLDVLPSSNRRPYDMYDVIRRIVDDGDWMDLKPQFARSIITCLARMGGRPVGIVASQPRHLGGILDNDAADKAARFVSLCDAFAIPLVFLVDVPGFMVGTKVEAAGIIRHGAKMLHAVAAATVPKVTVVIRKAYGAGYYVMNGRAYEPDLIVAWPTAEISVMGAEGAVEIIFRKEVEAADDPAAKKAELIAAYRGLIDVYVAAAQRDDRRRHRPARDAAGRDRRAGDGRRQAGGATVEAPRRHAGVTVAGGGDPPRRRGRVRPQRRGLRARAAGLSRTPPSTGSSPRCRAARRSTSRRAPASSRARSSRAAATSWRWSRWPRCGRAIAPPARAVDGIAEAIGLPDASADAVTVAQAFHWFDGPRALAEIHRVLRPGGVLALIWNRRDTRDALQGRITALLEPHRGGVPAHRDGTWRAALERDRALRLAARGDVRQRAGRRRRRARRPGRLDQLRRGDGRTPSGRRCSASCARWRAAARSRCATSSSCRSRAGLP